MTYVPGTFPTDLRPSSTDPIPADWANDVGETLNTFGPQLHQVNVSGTLTLDVQHEHTYEVTATSAATVTLSGLDGAQVALVWSGSGSTVAGVAVSAGNTYVAVKLSAGWVIYPVNPAMADTTAPTAGTLMVATGYTDATLSVSGATDDVALASAPYSYSKDNGTTWTAYQSGSTYGFTGLASGTSFTFRHRVKDAAGNVKVGAAVTASTPTPPTWTVWAADDFTAADGALAGRSTPTGSKAWAVSGGTFNIASNQLAVTAYGQATVGLPPLSSAGECHVRMTFDYVLSGTAQLGSYIQSNSLGQDVTAIWKSGTVTTLATGGTNDIWNTPTVALAAPASGTAVIEYWRKTTGDLLYTVTINGTVVLSASGSKVSGREQPTTSHRLGIFPIAGSSVVDNFKVEYIA